MGSIWGWQDPGGPHVGPINFAIWDMMCRFYGTDWYNDNNSMGVPTTIIALYYTVWIRICSRKYCTFKGFSRVCSELAGQNQWCQLCRITYARLMAFNCMNGLSTIDLRIDLLFFALETSQFSLVRLPFAYIHNNAYNSKRVFSNWLPL